AAPRVPLPDEMRILGECLRRREPLGPEASPDAPVSAERRDPARRRHPGAGDDSDARRRTQVPREGREAFLLDADGHHPMIRFGPFGGGPDRSTRLARRKPRGEKREMANETPITIARGDGIGPEIMDATLTILKAAGARLAIEEIEIGEKVYLRGNTAGIEPSAWESLRRTRVFLKAPITTPQGGGFKSLNVTTRKTLGLYANVRPCVSYFPFVATKHPVMDLVIVRENEEDTYAGVEYRLTPNVYECLKLITRPGSEKIVRYAFEYAVRNSRRRVTCFTKDNIMKMTDGLFHKVFDEVAKEYPEIQNEHWIVDIGAAKLADSPEAFDVIVMPNLYGDILSDVAAQIAGSVGLAGSSNIGQNYAMFEAIHGSAPRRAGQNVANPSGLLLGAVMMLVH